MTPPRMAEDRARDLLRRMGVTRSFTAGELVELANVIAAVPPPGATLDQAIALHIRRVLADCGDNRSRAAKALGISRRSLYRHIPARKAAA